MHSTYCNLNLVDLLFTHRNETPQTKVTEMSNSIQSAKALIQQEINLINLVNGTDVFVEIPDHMVVGVMKFGKCPKLSAKQLLTNFFESTK